MHSSVYGSVLLENKVKYSFFIQWRERTIIIIEPNKYFAYKNKRIVISMLYYNEIQ